ncbi:unnamed protein product [Spirodela intermedia]|uniref:Serine hydrolase domain-containing protein n=1 Tax=Spirodela intermedia TaxID=51605 RepID=A0A7I8J302_SPIIN|nr:unnamed protein product [Spirodela intermedia]CAA6664362.1 unnamed protein product [Spirodela intermedia]
MGNLVAEDDLATATATAKPRVLCLHGFRTSGEIMRKQVLEKWPEAVTSRLDLGKSDVEGIFAPPYYEWFQFDKAFKEYRNFDECLNYIEEFMIQHGPFDGLMGFSQGAILSAALPGMQAKGVALTRVPKLKFVTIIGGTNSLNTGSGRFNLLLFLHISSYNQHIINVK